MGPLAVVDPEPGVGKGAQLRDRLKEVRVQHLGSVAPVETFDVRVLVRLSWLDVVRGDAVFRAPVDEGLRASWTYVWSPRIVGWEVHDDELAERAATLIHRIGAESGVDPNGLVLHSNSGKPMRGNTMIATLQWLGIVPSFSRPHACNDNPYSAALFRTLKHTPAYPRLPFASRDAARQWVTRFVAWYNTEHRHSAIRSVTPDQRHSGADATILARRRVLYERARTRRPGRWSGTIRNWTPVATVVLNPERPATKLDAAAS